MDLIRAYHNNRGLVASLLGFLTSLIVVYLGACFTTLDWNWIVHVTADSRGGAVGILVVSTLVFTLLWDIKLDDQS